MSTIALRSLWKKYGKVEAVKGINLQIQDGEFFCILGPSGCGKTSTMRMIAGIESITAGEIWFDNQLVNDLAPVKRDVAMAFETYALYPPLTVKENLAFPLEARGEPKARINERVEEVAKILDLVDVLDQKPAQISGGHQQRVSLGRCIIRKPRVFLFDEPLSHVDSEARRKMRGEVKRLQQMFKTTSVYVTHDQSEAMALADRISVMNLGEVQQTGTPNEIYHHPHNLFVADFIGEPPFNFFDCSVVSDGGQLAFRTQVGNHRILVPNTIKERMGDSLDRVLRVGVRPMYITPSLVEQEDSQIHGTVYVFEGLGEEGVLTVDVDGSLIRILTEPDFEGKPGDRVWLNVDSSRIQVFDPKTTNNVLSC